jgi:ABC-type branched-subunit amino acid transport system substrate-binding protein
MKRIAAEIFLTTLLVCATHRAHAQSSDTIGVILPMTGDFARYGDKVREGLESKRPSSVRFVYEDEGCKPNSAVSAFQKLRAADRLNIFIGPWCGSPQVAVAGLVGKSGGLAILGSSAPERVFALSSGRMLSVQPSIEAESTFNATEAYRLGARKVAIVFLENDFSRAHEATFRKSFEGHVIDTLTYSSPDASALRALATRIKKLSPDTLYVPDASPLMHGLIRQLGNIGLTGLRIMSVYTAQSDDVLTAVGKAGEGLIFSHPKIEEEALHYYPRLASEILMQGLQECPNKTPDCIKKVITEKHHFNEHGTLQGELALKTISNGKFVWLLK